ncbi:penicillin-binding protein activator LpoB [Herbaspirillum sp. LeCh32-8]|uniref:penicillin-binding protein activator LpoB n=1 Tax=Herbaspirillum sp. LeCh32-8 TaxID=2821356 RepID=UPI001AE4C71E|nr:penicillin-binding protein activator LpoB [Herbaspirillum sp. LeCh32-8]MBP0600581.1 penicillin-binding protein activator LpoB [Herbaspirillum sp. LeCh32-8]
MKNQTIFSLSRLLRLAAAAVLAVGLAACTTTDIGRAPVLASNGQWGLLPFANHTETPQAGLRAEAIAESILRARGGANLRHYPATLNNETLFEPMDRKQMDAALEWARSENLSYALTGTVDEWRYKVGIDGEPAVGLTLQLVEVATGKVVWSAAGGKSGWSREALSAVAQKLSRTLLSPLTSLQRSAQDAEQATPAPAP